MSKIKKFLDFITGYTGFSNKLNRMVNRRQDDHFPPEAPLPNVSMTPEQILELYSMIRDYIAPIGDIDSVEVRWQEATVDRGFVNMKLRDTSAAWRMVLPQQKIGGLDTFIVHANLVVSDGVNINELLEEINSAKAQLASEDFKLECTIENRNMPIVYVHSLTVKHKSYKDPVQKRMRRAA